MQVVTVNFAVNSTCGHWHDTQGRPHKIIRIIRCGFDQAAGRVTSDIEVRR